MTSSERPIESLDPEMVRVLAAKSGAERLAIAAGMFRAARRMIASHLRAENPQWSEAMVQDEVALRISRGSG